jgi:hypothetical protein
MSTGLSLPALRDGTIREVFQETLSFGTIIDDDKEARALLADIKILLHGRC